MSVRRLRGSRLGLLLSLLAASACLQPGLAQAEYTPASLVSYTGSLEADDAYSPAISANGAYVAFTGSFDGVSGVYRKDLATGELALVAGADSAEPALSAPGAGSPSISEEGRYVSFTTTAHLDPDDDQPGETGGCSSVYVRDMDVPIGQPGAYTLASALNGTSEGIAYAGGDSAGCPGGGSASADRVALSGNGSEVAFTVLGESDLTTGPGGATSTPPDQVAVRNLRTDTTTLVSQTLSSLGATPEAVPGGAALASLRGLQSSDGRELSGSTAAISADGSTVAWMGVDIAAQAPASSPEDAGGSYDEPLWRRIAEGPDAPTRRVTGGDDPLCGCEGPLDTAFDPGAGDGAVGPEKGTYVAPDGFSSDPLVGSVASLDSVTPQLSANGQEVAILSTQPRTGEVGRALEEELFTSTANAYVVNMATGLSRSAALTQLTEWGGDKFNEGALTGAIDNIAISPDGTKVAFTTARIDFPLSPPALVTPALSQASFPQLYVADLGAGTLQMVSYGYDGEPANGTVATPSFTGDGETLAFASSATNLVYGAFDKGGKEDGGPGNVFVTSAVDSPAVPGESSISPPPASPLVSQRWEILLATRTERDGSVLLYATVPGAGSLKVVARAEVPVATSSRRRKAQGSARKDRGGTGRDRGGATGGSDASRRSDGANASRAKKSSSRRTVYAGHVVASAGAKPTHASLVQLRLTPRAADRSLVRGRDGLYATIAVAFSASGKSTLHGTVQATFKRSTKKARAKR